MLCKAGLPNTMRTFGLFPYPSSGNSVSDVYVILSPSGKIISNSGGRYQTFEFDDFLSNPQCVVDVGKYLGRGGVYDWKK